MMKTYKVFNIFGSGPHRNMISDERLNELAGLGWKLVDVVAPTMWQVQNQVVLSIWEGEDAIIPQPVKKPQHDTSLDEKPLDKEEQKDEVLRKRGRPRKIVAEV